MRGYETQFCTMQFGFHGGWEGSRARFAQGWYIPWDHRVGECWERGAAPTHIFLGGAVAGTRTARALMGLGDSMCMGVEG